MLKNRTFTLPQQLLLGVVGTVGFAVLWELLIRSNLVTKVGLPVPSKMVTEAVVLLQNATFWENVGYTLNGWLLGILIAAVAGVILGALMGAFRSVFIAFELPVEAFRTLPSIAVGPILVMLFPSSMLPLALTVALSCVWPILLNTMYGIRSTDSTAVQTAQSFGISKVGIMLKIRLMSALPFAFTGIRVAASIGLIVMVSAELLIGSGQGIGGFILVASANATTLDAVYAATLITGVLGVLISMIFVLLDNTLFAWKKGLAQ